MAMAGVVGSAIAIDKTPSCYGFLRYSRAALRLRLLSTSCNDLAHGSTRRAGQTAFCGFANASIYCFVSSGWLIFSKYSFWIWSVDWSALTARISLTIVSIQFFISNSPSSRLAGEASPA